MSEDHIHIRNMSPGDLALMKNLAEAAAEKTVQNDQRWHLDKRVPLALIVTILLQSGTFIWWASSLTERVGALERTAIATAPQADRLTRVEVRVESIQAGVDRIERLIRREVP